MSNYGEANVSKSGYCYRHGFNPMSKDYLTEDKDKVTLSGDRIEIIRLTGLLIRGDWSMTSFDGRDVKRWLDTALYGNPIEVATILTSLRERNKE